MRERFVNIITESAIIVFFFFSWKKRQAAFEHFKTPVLYVKRIQHVLSNSCKRNHIQIHLRGLRLGRDGDCSAAHSPLTSKTTKNKYKTEG